MADALDRDSLEGCSDLRVIQSILFPFLAHQYEENNRNLDYGLVRDY